MKPGSLWPIDGADVGLRLDKFLAAAHRLGSRARAVTAIGRGKVFLNDTEARVSDAATRVAAGDVVRVWMDRPGSAKRRPSPHRAGTIHIVYEDDDLIVVDKPAGLLAVPLERRGGAPSVLNEIDDHLRSHRTRRPFVVHRIDRDTSGLVVFAKHAAAHAVLKGQFMRHEPERVYRAVVYGRPVPPSGTWRDRLVWDRQSLIQRETHPRDPQGKDAISEYRVIEAFRETSLIEVRLVTGKRNQIRLQARLRGHTLVDEQRYIFGPDALRPIDFPRQALHAFRLTFTHPTTRQPLSFEAAMPEDINGLVAELRAESQTRSRRKPTPPSGTRRAKGDIRSEG